MPIFNRKINFYGDLVDFEELNQEGYSVYYDSIIYEVLRDLCFVANHKGFEYIKDAVVYCLANNITSINGTIYNVLAKKHKSTYARVERNIRSAIEKAWLMADPDVIDDLYGHFEENETCRPENLVFIKTIALIVRKKVTKTVK